MTSGGRRIGTELGSIEALETVASGSIEALGCGASEAC